MATTIALAVAAPLSDEDAARADYYALLARLYFDAPDAALLSAIAAAPAIGAEDAAETAAPLAAAWAGLQAAGRAADPDALRVEFATVFIGTGKALVTPYFSYYVAPSLRDRFLVRLRESLGGLGLARVGSAGAYEDHVAGLCEVMRHLIMQGGEGSGVAALQQQKALFINYIQHSYGAFSRSVVTCEQAEFYRHVARFTEAFLDIEKEALSMV